MQATQRCPPTGLQGGALAVQQQQRCLADAAVATKVSIWDELGDLVTSDDGKRELATLRSTYADISLKLAGLAKVGGQGGAWGSRRSLQLWVGAVAAVSGDGGGRWGREAPGSRLPAHALSLPIALPADPGGHQLGGVGQGDRPQAGAAV